MVYTLQPSKFIQLQKLSGDQMLKIFCQIVVNIFFSCFFEIKMGMKLFKFEKPQKIHLNFEFVASHTKLIDLNFK